MPSEETEIAKPIICVVIRSGIEIWIDQEKLPNFDESFKRARQMQGLMEYEGERINPADVVGVFKAATMDEATRRKNGQWKCQEGTWHDRGQKCECKPRGEVEIAEKREALIKACGKCHRGFIQGERGMRKCSCIEEFDAKHYQKKQ